ncbi:hypothetical protein D1872_286520 [compost metagenome]
MPRVRVPVLSKTTIFTWESLSRALPPFTNTPLPARDAAVERDATLDVIMKALGQPARRMLTLASRPARMRAPRLAARRVMV